MLEPGTQVGPYEIVALLGAGGMGEVYRARDPRLGRLVAVKILPPAVANDPGRRQRFEQEARAASALNHPNILSVYDTGEYNGLVFMVTELIEGESLREPIKRGPLPVSRVIDISSQVAAGLAAAHNAGIVHRDIKPENIMLTRDGRVKILDFGLAKQSAPSGAAATSDDARTQSITSAGQIMGTAAYMSPEQIRGETVDHRSDIFSLGLVIYECLAGKTPFERPTLVEVMTAILREDPADLPDTTSPALRQIVWHCLEKEPEHRFHSARDLGFALRTATSSARTSGPVAEIPQSGPMELPASLRPGWFWPALAAVLAALCAILFLARYTQAAGVDLTRYRLLPFATDAEVESEGAWSPDGKSIAYLKTVDGVPQLMVRELDSPSPIQLTQTEFPVRQTFWAPDASLLYFVLETSRGELWGISPAGGQPTRILDGVVTANVSPDGKALAIWRVSAQGASPRGGAAPNPSGATPPIPSPNPSNAAPANPPPGGAPGASRGAAPKIRGSVWISSPPGSPPKRYQPAPFETPEIDVNNRVAFSPDGHSILLTEGNGASQAWLLPYPAGGAPKRLFANTDLGVSPRASWMPDSRHVILSFAGSLSGGSDLWMADVETEKMTQLTFGTLSREQPSLAPDGTRLVFSNIQDDFNVIQLSLAGGPPKTLLGNARNELSPSWSPEGDQLAYSTDRTGEREIWIRNLTDGLDRPVVRAKDFPKGSTTGLTSPVYSPDGSRIAFVRYSSEDPATIWVAPAVGGAPIRLTGEYMVSPVWAPDGGRVAGLMQRDNPGEPAIVGVGADMTPHLIPHAPLCRSPLAWSPTGQWLACESREDIALFSEDGSQQRRLPKTDAASLVFSQDGKTIYAMGRAEGRSFLKSIDVASGASRIIADYGPDLIFSGGMPYHTRLSLSPDGKTLVTSAVALKSDLWLLDGYPMPKPWWKFW